MLTIYFHFAQIAWKSCQNYLGLSTDLNECVANVHNCPAGQVCMNTIGGYRCTCPTGYEFNLTTKVCQDEDECLKFDGHVCSVNAKCENTIGSFKCHCKDGFKLHPDGRQCEDIDECETKSSGCQQICTNVPGSFICGCNEGFTLVNDGKTCEDIDECEVWGRPGSNLCLGRCVNTPGSFQCECPQGFRLKADKRTCEDIDECQEGHCPGDDHVCVNMLGSYRCVEMKCPRNYIRDLKFKHRCNRLYSCTYGEKECLDTPLSTSYNLIGMPNQVDFAMLKDASHLPLFTMRGPALKDTEAEFDLKLRAVRISPWEKPSTVSSRDSFLVEKGKKPNSVLVSLQEGLEGPQEVRLDLEMSVKHSGVFAGKAVAHLHIYVSRYSLGKYVTYNPKGEHNDILTFNDP